MKISLIAAIGKNRELGKQNKLIWHISDDLKRVKSITMGHPIIMGRKTYDSIGHPLPGRTNIVVTSQNLCIDGCLVVSSIEKAIAAATAIDNEEIFIFGGASLYEKTIGKADRLYLTIIDAADTEADVFFPDYSNFSNIIESVVRTQDTLSYTWQIRERSAV